MPIYLLYNISIFVVLSILSAAIESINVKSGLKIIIQGIFFGLITIVGMKFAYVIGENNFIDCRPIGITLSTILYGPIAGLITSLIVFIARLFVVGTAGSLLGVTMIITVYFINLVLYLWIRKKIITNQICLKYGSYHS